MSASSHDTHSPGRDIFAVLGCEVALVVALHLAGRYSPTVDFGSFYLWLSEADPVDTLTALARYSGLAIAYWLLGTTIANLVAVWGRWEFAIDVLSWITLPSIRRLAYGMTAASLVAATIAGPGADSPALAESQAQLATTKTNSNVGSQGANPTPKPESRFGLAFSLLSDGSQDAGPSAAPQDSTYQPTAAGWPATSEDPNFEFWLPDTNAETPGNESAADTSRPETTNASAANKAAASHRVAKGESLWSISESHIRTSTDHSPTNAEIAEYWISVVDANKDSIRSGDINLIYPGETIKLPARS